MRKYYNDFNEEYERGFRDGRREALRESSSDLFSFEEVNDIISKTARKYGLKVSKHTPKDLYFAIEIEHVGRLSFYVDRDLGSFDKEEKSVICKISIEGYFNNGNSEKNIKEFGDKVKQVNALFNIWKELDSIDLTYKMFL